MEEKIKKREKEEDFSGIDEFYQTLLKTIPFGMDIVDENGNVFFVNDKLKAIFNEDIVGKKCWEQYRDDHRQCSDCPLRKGINVGETATVETTGALGGKTLQITHTGMIYKGKKAILEIFEDITDRKKTELALRDSEIKYKTLYDSSRDAIMILDPDKGFISGNLATLEMFRCKDEPEFISQSPASLSPDFQPDGSDSSIKAKEAIDKAMKEGSHFFEWKHKRLNGEEFFATVLLTKMNLYGRDILQATVRDVSEQKKTQEQISQAREYAERIISLTPSALFTVDKNRVVTSWNKRAEEITGFTADEVLGKNCLLFADEPCKDKCGLFSNGTSAPVFARECMIRTKGGEKRIALKNSDLFRDKEGNVIGGIESFEDITDRKKAEQGLIDTKKELEAQTWGLKKTNETMKLLYQELEQRNEELKKLDQLKSDFVSTVSHELRTPLAITIEGISLVIDGIVGPVSEKQKDLLKTSKENLDRLGKIINDLLDISKIEAGRLELRRGLTDATKLLKNLADSYQTVVAPKKISLISEIPDESQFLFVDGDKMIQALNNLINNAIKFTKEGGTVEVKLSVREEDILFSVRDDGIGISEKDMKKLFSKFQQFSRTAGPGIKGTGLGLSITKALIEMHGGKIWAESQLGEGTTFFFTVPSYNSIIKEFNNCIDEALKESKETGKPASFLVVQLKNSKEVISQFDENILVDIMNRMIMAIGQVASRPKDRHVIFNQDTIHIILPETDISGSLATARRIKDELLKASFVYDKKEVDLDIKFGIATFPVDAASREDLLAVSYQFMNKPKTILVVDDHPQIVRILQIRLENLGYRTRVALNGKEAIDSIEEELPDLLILDIMMPEMNGYEVYGRLKERPETSGIPVVMLSAHDVDRGNLDSVLPGSVPIIQKTGGFENVITTVENML